MIDVDGSKGEGGGQILRTTLALSALTNQDVRIHSIRSGRPNPGLQAQHLCAVRGVAQLCEARVEGDELGSSVLRFYPGNVRGGVYHLSVGTAGSITLVLQACLLASARCPETTRFEVMGGTNVKWSPPIDFYQHLMLPMLSRMGFQARFEEIRRGFYPEGGGRVLIDWRPPSRIDPLDIPQRGALEGVEGCVFSQNLPEHVGQRIGAVLRKGPVGEAIELRNERSNGPSTGAGVFLMARYSNTLLSGDSLGEKGVAAEKVGESALVALKEEMSKEVTLDVHAADQLLPFMALAAGVSRFLVREVTGHLATQSEIVRLFLGTEIGFEKFGRSTRVEVRPKCTYNS